MNWLRPVTRRLSILSKQVYSVSIFYVQYSIGQIIFISKNVFHEPKKLYKLKAMGQNNGLSQKFMCFWAAPLINFACSILESIHSDNISVMLLCVLFYYAVSNHSSIWDTTLVYAYMFDRTNLHGVYGWFESKETNSNVHLYKMIICYVYSIQSIYNNNNM